MWTERRLVRVRIQLYTHNRLLLSMITLRFSYRSQLTSDQQHGWMSFNRILAGCSQIERASGDGWWLRPTQARVEVGGREKGLERMNNAIADIFKALSLMEPNENWAVRYSNDKRCYWCYWSQEKLLLYCNFYSMVMQALIYSELQYGFFSTIISLKYCSYI